MLQSLPKVRGLFLLGVYLCLMGLMLVAPENLNWLKQVSSWLAIPLLVLFFYLNTSIDSKFEKSVFYGIGLFALSVPLQLTESVLGQSTLYLIMAAWLIGYFSYARAFISITSVSNSLLFKHKWVAGVIFGIGLMGLYFLITTISTKGSSIIPWICLGLSSIVYFMSAFNLRGQLHTLPASSFIAGSMVLILFNCLVGLNITSNISIFDSGFSILFYLGQLLMIFAAVRCSVQFRNNDFTGISSVLNKKNENL